MLASGLNATLQTGTRMPFEGQEVLARRCVPDIDRAVPTPAGQAFAVWTERYAFDRAYGNPA